MKYESGAAFRTALEARLKAQRSDGVGISRLRKRIVFERLLARLQVAAPTGWLLKGGFALELRLGDRARTTKDIDIDWTLDEPDATELLLDAITYNLDDLFTFTTQRTTTEDDPAGGGQRWTIHAELGGREFERVAIDVSFSKPPVLEPDTLVASQLLQFADIDPVVVPALAIEQHLAEKLHAYTRTYAANQPSSRVKDLVDLVVIARTTTVDAERLAEAANAIFQRRATHDVPTQLNRPPSDWARPWQTLVAHLPADAELAAGYQVAARFWNPVLAHANRTTVWDPTSVRWRPRE